MLNLGDTIKASHWMCHIRSGGEAAKRKWSGERKALVSTGSSPLRCSVQLHKISACSQPVFISSKEKLH